MSNLENLIKKCRKVWREMKIPRKEVNEMLDTLLGIKFKEWDSITEEKIKNATENWLKFKKGE
jgi:hypothetical protein